MSKTVLVMDIPNSCDKCPLCFDSYGQCDLCAATGKLDKCGDMIYEEVIKKIRKRQNQRLDYSSFLPGER